MESNETYLRRSILLAQASMKKGNPPYGALLVIDDQIVMESENTEVTMRDVTRHAELSLVSRAVQVFTKEQLAKATLFASAEPCLMCTGAVYWSGIKNVIYACSKDSVSKYKGTDTVDLRIEGPLLEEEGSRVHEQYW